MIIKIFSLISFTLSILKYRVDGEGYRHECRDTRRLWEASLQSEEHAVESWDWHTGDTAEGWEWSRPIKKIDDLPYHLQAFEGPFVQCD